MGLRVTAQADESGVKTQNLSEEPKSSEREVEASRTKADASVRRVKAGGRCVPHRSWRLGQRSRPGGSG